MHEHKNQFEWSSYEEDFRKLARKNKFSDSYINTCITYAKKLYDNNCPIIFDGIHLSSLVGYNVSYIFGATNAKNFYYRDFFISKNNGRKRQISEPLPSLKEIQRWILENILAAIPVHAAAKAYLPGTSIYDNARFHRGQSLVLKMDIKDFFPSIRTKYINAVFKRIGYSGAVSKLLTELVTYNHCLPQGAPTSPALSNIIMFKIDRRILGYAKSKKLRYTRYADDLTISGDFSPAEVISFVERVVKETGFKVNREKTCVIKRSARQLVTGIVVNEKLQAPKDIRRKIRQELHYIKKFGLDSHLSSTDSLQSNYVEHLKGLANHILSINKKDKDALALINFFKTPSNN